MSIIDELNQRPCPTCHCTLYSEFDDLEPGIIRDAIRWRKLRACGGWPDSESAASDQPPEWFDALADGLPDELMEQRQVGKLGDK